MNIWLSTKKYINLNVGDGRKKDQKTYGSLSWMQQIFCKDCLYLNNKNNVNHHLIPFYKIDIIFPLYKSKYTYECKKNLYEDYDKNKNDLYRFITI